MRKIFTVILTVLLITTMSACSDDTQATSTAGQGGQNSQAAMSNNQTVGLVAEVLGNEVTLEIGEMQGGAMGGGGNMPEGTERPSEGGEMPEGMERPSEGGEMPEGMERPSEGGEMPERESGQATEGAQRPSGEGNAAPGAGMVGEDTDYSELITLTGETQTINIPVGTPVTQFGTEMTFSQIMEDMYISIALDEDENVISVNILG